jgi:hypothetical protein
MSCWGRLRFFITLNAINNSLNMKIKNRPLRRIIFQISSFLVLLLGTTSLQAQTTAVAYAIQASCESDGSINADGFIQLSAVTMGLSYSVNIGGAHDGTGPRTTLIGATYPLQILTGLANPPADQAYTIRVYPDDVGGSATPFTDVIVNLAVQDCTVGCDCVDQIYLNEPGFGTVYKFSVNPSNGDLTEIGSPWYGGSELSAPHGLGVDVNGFIYIGETLGSTSDIRKFTCDGEIFDEADFAYREGGYNMGSYDGILYTNDAFVTPNPGITAYDPCNDEVLGTLSFCETGTGDDDDDWGLWIDPNTGIGYAVNNLFLPGGVTEHYLHIFNVSDLDLGGGTTCSTAALQITDFPPGVGFGWFIYGITTDLDGNIYMVLDDGVIGTLVSKYDANLNHVAFSAIDSDAFDGVGYAASAAIVYSASSDKLYVASQADFESCLTSFSTDLTIIEEEVGPTSVPGSYVKGMAIVAECCPTNNNQTVNQVLCSSSSTEDIFLNIEFPCSGTICEGQWVPADAASLAVYDECKQSIMVGTVAGCYTFTRSSDGTGAKSQCGAFVQTFTISIGSVMASIAGGDQQICRGSDPEPFTIESVATGSDNLSFQWYVSTESDSTGFTPIADATTEVYDPTIADITADTMYFRNEVSISTCTGDMCRDTSNTVLVITVQDVTVDAGDDVSVCNASTIDLTAASITPADFMAMDGTPLGATWTSSGTGMFFDAGGALLPAPVRLGEAISYQLSAADATAGEVSLTLTTDNLSGAPFDLVGCMPFGDELTITILNVDCGTYPWDGSND